MSFAKQFTLQHPMIIVGAIAVMGGYLYYRSKNAVPVVTDASPANPAPRTVTLPDGQVSTYVGDSALYPVDPTTGLAAPRTFWGKLFWEPASLFGLG